MSEVTAERPVESIELEELLGPKVTALPSHPFEPCDGHAEPTTQALYAVKLTTGGVLHFCGHCGRKSPYPVHEVPSFIEAENKKQGSEH